MRPDICTHARAHAIELSYESVPQLGERVQEALEPYEGVPQAMIPADLDAANAIKPLQYALIAKVINGLVEVELPDVDRHYLESQRPLHQLAVLRNRLPIFGLVMYDLGAELTCKLDRYAINPENKELLRHHNAITRLQARLEVVTENEEPLRILHGGIGTASRTTSNILALFSDHLKAQYLPPDERESVLRASPSALIEAAQYNVSQINALPDILTAKNPPDVCPTGRGSLRFEPSPLHVPYPDISDDKEKVAWTLSSMSSATDTIGCPVLFRPQQAQAIWNRGIDIASELKLI